MKTKGIARSISILVMNLALFTASSARATDCGSYGHLFKIEEESFLEMIARKGAFLERSGKLAELQKKVRSIAEDRVNAPKSISGIKRAIEDREWLHDPSHEFDEDVVLPCGKVLFRAGVRVNPLEHMTLERRIFFIDGRDAQQVKWLKERIRGARAAGGDGAVEDRIILVGGSPIELSDQLGMNVYFDQHDGYMAKKWGIRAVPAVAQQEGAMLKIREVRI